MTAFADVVRLIESFELYLGNPASTKTPMNFQQSLIYDEQDTLAWPQLEFVQQWGYMDYLVPQNLGGKMTSLDVLYLLGKSLARRDITTANALGLAFFAALPIWIAGDAEQKKALAIRVRQGEIGALALTEEHHGSDLTNNEMSAHATETGWEVSGKKWCVNFATIGKTVGVLCRTHKQGGVLGFSLFFVDKSLAESGIDYLPKLPTHGVRGLDISGFTFDRLKLPKNALIGKEQRGLEITYKVFQISRTLCASLCVGAADTALRLALAFSLERHLYGKPAYEIPAVQQRLGEQFVQLLIADCMSLVIMRACTIMPEKMSLWSAIIKFLVPRITEDVVEQCGIILGARAFLRTTEWAVFQKIRRDIQVVGLFDGSSQINLSLIAGNLIPQATRRGSNELADAAKLEHIFNLGRECPPFEDDKLRLVTSEEDDIFAGLKLIKAEAVSHLVQRVQQQIQRLDRDVLELKESKRFDPRGLGTFRVAEDYCWIFAASCCLQFWYYNQSSLPIELQDVAWLELAIQLILNKLQIRSCIDVALQEKMSTALCAYYQKHQLFSVVPAKIVE